MIPASMSLPVYSMNSTFSLQPALFLAVEEENSELVAQHLRAGADPNFPNLENETALHIAVRKNSLGMAELLLQFGADSNCQPFEHLTPFHLAAELGDCRMASLLLEYDANDKLLAFQRESALDLSIQNDQVEMARFLLDRGANPDGPGFRQPPLVAAVQNENIESVRLLLTYGANPNFRIRKDDFTALHIAAAKGLTEIALLLLQKKANPKLTDFEKKTPCDLAIDSGHLETVRVFVKFFGF